MFSDTWTPHNLLEQGLDRHRSLGEPVREDLLRIDDRPSSLTEASFVRLPLALLQKCLRSEELSNMQHPKQHPKREGGSPTASIEGGCP